MELIDYFPGYLLSQLYSDLITRQDYFVRLFLHNKHFHHFNSEFSAFCKLQESEVAPSLDCILFRGICSTMFRRPRKIQKDWRKMLLEECNKLQNKCFWASKLAQILKKSKEKASVPFQYEILALNFIYSSESDESFYYFSREFREKLLFSKIKSKKINNFTGEDSEYLDSEIYSRARSKYEPYEYEISSKKSFNDAGSYQNNTIIGIHKTSNHSQGNSRTYEEIVFVKKKALTHYKLITDVIEDHLEKKGHPLKEVKDIFIKEFVCFFGEKSPNLIYINQEEKYKAMVANLIEFIRIFQQVILIFYGLGSAKLFLKSMSYFTHENLLEFITSLFINTTEIYELLFRAATAINTEIEEKIENNYRIFRNYKPQNFGVSKELCLNFKTLQFFKGVDETINTFKIKELADPHFDNIIERKITWDINNEYLLDDQNQEGCCSIKSPLSIKDHFQGFEKQNNVEERNQILGFEKDVDLCNFKKSLIDKTLILSEHKKNYDSRRAQNKNGKFEMGLEETACEESASSVDLPYYSAISNLKKISKLKSPIHKMKNILKTAVLIIESIRKYYEKYNRKFNDDEINSDEIMSILIYICCKAEIKAIYSQCVLVESFLTSQLSSSVTGYYLITIKAALEYIGSDEMLKEKNK